MDKKKSLIDRKRQTNSVHSSAAVNDNGQLTLNCQQCN